MLAVLANFSQSSAKITQQTVEFPAPIDGFQLLEDGQGWVLLGNQLFWSTDAGRSWSDITPVGAETIRAVYFSDTQNGFLVDQEITTDGLITYTLRYTSDLGSSWSPRPLDSLSLYDPSASAEAVHIHFLDSTTGWIVLKQATSSNFNLGVIYRTSDGGQTWESYPGPSGEPVIFLNLSIGFMIGGPRMDTLFRTNDGGRSWFPVDLGLDKVAMLSLPTLLTQSVGHMAAATSSNSGTDLVILETADLGETWLEKSRYHLTDEAEKFPLIASFPGAIKAFSADQTVTFWQTTGDFAGTANQFSDSLSKVILTGTGHGWARSNRFTCTDPDDRATCVAETGLVHTANGGATWQSLTTPSVYIQIIVEEPIKLAREVDFHRDRTAIWQGQGFDQCKLSTLGNLQSWKTNSPLSTVNLYIGGAALACTNQPFFSNTGYISALSLQGWKFIPTWVGPQAACTNFSKRMSLDPNTAYNQGRDQAEDASRVAMKLGLGEADRSGTVIYYDLEAFNTNDTQCLAAAKAFIDGWVWKLHQYDITAGVYGSVCASGLDHFYTLDNPPDVIWPAAWSSTVYNSALTPDNLPCLNNAQWGNQQRILQYTGAHSETWGNTSMHIDLDVIDGLVADISNFVGAPPTVLENGSFESGLIAPWEIKANQSACDWSVVNNSNQAQFANHYLAINKDPDDTNCEGVSQTLVHPPVYGDRYRFAVWARSAQAGSLRSLHLDLTTEGTSSDTTSQAFSGIGADWVCLEMDHIIGQNGLTGVTASIIVDDTDGIDLWIDSAQVTVNTGKLCPTIPIPTNLKASDAGDDERVFVSWDSVPSATFYKVYRHTNANPSEILLDRAYTNEYTDTNGDPYTDFYYTVKACHAGGCSKSSNRDLGSIAYPFYTFFDGFEDSNFNNWDSSINSPGNIRTCQTSNLNGNYSLCIDAAMTSSAFLVKNLATPAKDLEVKFKFDPNNVDYKNYVYNLVKLIDTQNGRQPLTVQVHNAPTGYYLRISAQVDNGPQTSSAWVAISDKPVEIMLKWWSTIGESRSAAVFSGATLTIDGAKVSELSGLINQQLSVDRILVGGLVNSTPTGANGIYYMDNFSFWSPELNRPTVP